MKIENPERMGTCVRMAAVSSFLIRINLRSSAVRFRSRYGDDATMSRDPSDFSAL
jgi:hypothetical protein